EQLCPLERCLDALARATGGALREPDTIFGDFSRGTARRLYIVTRADHFTQAANPVVTRRCLQWLECSLGNTEGRYPGGWLVVVTVALATALVGGVLAAVWLLGKVVRALPADDGPRPWHVRHLLCFDVLLALLVPLVAFVSGWLDAGPVYFALPCLL